MTAATRRLYGEQVKAKNRIIDDVIARRPARRRSSKSFTKAELKEIRERTEEWKKNQKRRIRKSKRNSKAKKRRSKRGSKTKKRRSKRGSKTKKRRSKRSSKTKKRKGPSASATSFKLGTRKRGNDRNMWYVGRTKSGVRRWKRS